MANQQTLQKKKDIVKNIADRMKASKSMVYVDHRGLTVEQDTELRTALRKAGVKYSVEKNTYLSFAAKENNLDAICPHLNGPTAVATSENDLVAPAKILSEFSKKYEHLQLKVGVVEGNVIDANGITELAELPSKEVLIAKVLGGLNTPITNFVTVLNANIKSLVVALNAIAEKKQ